MPHEAEQTRKGYQQRPDVVERRKDYQKQKSYASLSTHKYTHEECDYRESEWPHECGTCAHYGYLSGTKKPRCRIVQSPIEELGLCNFWTAGRRPLERENEEI